MMRENYKVFLIGILLISFIGFSAAGQVTKITKSGTAVVKKDYRVWYDTVYTYKSWRPLDTTGYKYSTHKYNICADTKGIIYFISHEKTYKIIEDKFIEISPNKEPCYDLNINEKDELLLRTWGKPEFKSRYYLYKAGAWEPVTDETFITAFLKEYNYRYESPVRQLSNKPANPPYKYKYKTGYLQYPRNRYLFWESSRIKGFIYEFVNGQWKTLSEFTWGKLDQKEAFKSDLIFTDHGLYSLIDGTFHKQDTSFTISITEHREYFNKKVPIVVAEKDKKDAEEAYPVYIGIFEQGDKLGLRTSAGKIVAHPVFKSITFEKNPVLEMDHFFIFHLKGDGMDVYCYKKNEDPDHLYGFIASVDDCKKCEGLGKLKHNQAPCDVCDGGKRASIINRNKYEFDKSSRKYIRRFHISYFGLDGQNRSQ